MASRDLGELVQLVANVLGAESKTPDELAVVLEVLKTLQAEGEEGKLKEAAKICADASRKVDWRTPLGESQILTFFQDILSSSYKDHELGLQALRLIGNSCADNDANRQRVTEHPQSLNPVIQSIKNPDLQTVGTVVLYNICMEHEPSQLKAISDGACPTLLSIIAREGFLEDGELDDFTRILEMLLSHDEGKSSCDPSSLQTLHRLSASPYCTFDDYLSLLTILSALLSSSTFQTHLITLDLLPQTLDLLERSYTIMPPSAVKQDEKLICYARNALIENIGDVSAQEGFLVTYPLNSPLISRVTSWLDVTDETKVDFIVTACLILGNVGRSDEVCGSLVRDLGVHEALLRIIKHTVKRYNDAVEEVKKRRGDPVPAPEGEKSGAGTGAVAVGVLHTATGVLKNLAIAKGNKEVLGGAGALDVIQEMLSMEGVGVGQVWYSAVGFGRLVCINCLDNVKLFLEPSPAGPDRTLLSKFLHIYNAAEELPTKTEIARTIAAVLRALNSPPSTSSSSPTFPELETALYSHEISRPLWNMIIQDKWPIVRSEGLFALVLMARGATEDVWKECKEEEEKVLRSLQGKDLDNAIILVADITKRLGDRTEDRLGELLAAVLEARGKSEQKE